MQPYYPECYALVSGGKDSLSTAMVLHEAGKLLGAVSFDTGISTPDWKAFVVKTCADRGWPLEMYRTGEDYDNLVRKYGFPGPGKHGIFMNYLKGRCVRKFKAAHPDGVLASGTRKSESARRLNSTKPISVWEGVPILTPIYNWTTEEVWAYFRAKGFERSPAYATLGISGDCLCGAFAREDEIDAINYHYPEVARRLGGLEQQLRAKGSKRCDWGWGWKEPRKKTAKEAAICVECGDAAPIGGGGRG